MKTIELNDDDWARLKRKLMNGSVDDALKDYTPPVKLTHGNEYITYEKEGYEDAAYFRIAPPSRSWRKPARRAC